MKNDNIYIYLFCIEINIINDLNNRSYHEETISNPDFFPATRTFRYCHGLTVNSYYPSRCFAHGTSRYVSTNFWSRYWCHHHRHRLGCAEPVAIVVTIGIVAHVIQVAEQEGHSRELLDATTSSACYLHYTLFIYQLNCTLVKNYFQICVSSSQLCIFIISKL